MWNVRPVIGWIFLIYLVEDGVATVQKVGTVVWCRVKRSSECLEGDVISAITICVGCAIRRRQRKLKNTSMGIKQYIKTAFQKSCILINYLLWRYFISCTSYRLILKHSTPTTQTIAPRFARVEYLVLISKSIAILRRNLHKSARILYSWKL